MNSIKRLVWSPQVGPQAALIKCPYPEVLFGGARGGGKTDGVLGKWAIRAGMYGEHFNAIMFRRTTPSQDDAWERAKELYGPLGARFVGGNNKAVRFPSGGRIRFRPLENVDHADKYQGQNLTDAWVEEAGQYPDPAPIDRLHGALRSAHGVPTQLILTANPGGAGQFWIKQRYIDPAPKGMARLIRELPNGAEHKFIYIPSRIQDNRILLSHDPTYVDRLYLVGSKELVRAWLDGDWNAVEGAFFDCWSSKMVIRPVSLPEHWMRFRSGDWGSARPGSYGWWAVASESWQHPDGQIIPRGALIRYREWYTSSSPNVGTKLTAEQVAEGIKEREDDDENIEYGVLDPAAFAEDGGPSLAERMAKRDIWWRRADNRRVAKDGAIGGWDQVRARMIGEDDHPMIYCFSTCTDSIRTIPYLQHDPSRAEDLDTESEDHAADEWRYAAMSRPYTVPKPKKPKDPLESFNRPPTMDELMQQVLRANKGERRI